MDREADRQIDDDADNGGLSRVTIVKKRLDATKRKREEELKGVSQFILPRTGKGQPLGKDWNGGELSGDKDWFAAGYDYSVGWEVGPAKTENDIVCQVEGSAHGDMSFDAWIIGGKISVVDGAVRAEAKPANGGTARFNAHLEMMGQSVFNTDGWKTAQTFQPGDDVGFGRSDAARQRRGQWVRTQVDREPGPLVGVERLHQRQQLVGRAGDIGTGIEDHGHQVEEHTFEGAVQLVDGHTADSC